ncbi:MAG: hypothetical protein DKM50_10455 [Candidatus Margulisiibacteriota bacterium]|nr:MAG: hypothetical protein A2X43_07150 [Candidatus Margulisbacteria bacterium GWD2_39_127]PZM78737.1 MAG: hypothetical protein DKM50_10455 [Candidatus Margulisiibacteriota bacterium]HAR63361.1 hypothetical protein [Candidatus Margulisiibacteriota bacterium]HCY36416.1 hypothetical protein [Candidatus Margulisiibacteriota bacterium]
MKLLKRTIIAVIALIFIMAQATIGDVVVTKAEKSETFVLKDISEKDPYAKEIYYFVTNKLLIPNKGNLFNSDRLINKSQFITFIVSLTDKDDNYKYSNFFVDVPEDYSAAPAICRAVNLKLIGVPDNKKFYPKSFIEEKEAAEIINKLLVFPKNYYNGSANLASGSSPLEDRIYLSRGKMVEMLSNTDRFSDKIAKFKNEFKFPKREANVFIKNKLLDDSVSKYLNTKKSEDLINDVHNIIKQNDFDEIIEEKLARALKYINEWKFYDAVKECNEVLDVDPKNVAALMRRGSANFLLDNFDKARQDWNNVLKIDPDNKLVREFLQHEGRQQDRAFIGKQTELEQTLETRLQNVIRKKLNIKDIVVLLKLDIGIDLFSPIQEKSLLPGVPIQSTNLYDKYFIKDVNVYITVPTDIDSNKEKKIVGIVNGFFDFPVKMNKNLFITKDKISDESMSSVADKFFNNNQNIQEELNRNLKLVEDRLSKNEEIAYRVRKDTVLDVQNIVDKFRAEYKSVSQTGDFSDSQSKKSLALGINHYVSIANTAAIIVVILLIGVLFRKSLSVVSDGVTKMADKSGAASSSALTLGAGYGASEGSKDAGSGPIGAAASIDLTSNSFVGFFAFVNEGNIFKLRNLLKSEYEQGQIDLEKISIILSYLSPSMANIILSQLCHLEQAEVLSYLVYSNQYSKEEIEFLDTRIREKLSSLVGGREVVLGLLNQIRDNDKTELTKVMAERFPDVLEEIRDMILLFEDLLLLDDTALRQIFSVVDPYIAAAAIVHIDNTDSEHIRSILTEGMRDMVNQVIELKSKTITNIEVIDAQEQVVGVAKHLSKQGIVTLIKKSFGHIGKASQEDIDAFIRNALPGGVPGSLLISDSVDAEKVIASIENSK